MLANDRLRFIRVKIERAYKHLDELEAVVHSLGEQTLMTIRIERESETVRPVLKADPVLIYGLEIPAIAGDVVHNLRSALDHLAFQLVSAGVEAGETRPNGRWFDIQFPILYSFANYEDKKSQVLQGAQQDAIDAIDKLKPYQGGDNRLWLLRQLDNTDKHSFIILPGENAIVGGLALHINNPYFTSLGVPKQKRQMESTGMECLAKTEVGISDALLPALHQLAELVSDIVTQFHRFLE